MAAYVLLGAWILIWAITSILYPKWIFQEVERDFVRRQGDKRKYWFRQQLNLFLLAAVLLASAFLPSSVRLGICLAGAAAVLASILRCNKRYLIPAAPFHPSFDPESPPAGTCTASPLFSWMDCGGMPPAQFSAGNGRKICARTDCPKNFEKGLDKYILLR